MLKLQLEDKEYFLPEGYDELTLRKYMELIPILRDEKDGIKRTVRMISILTDIPEDEVYMIDVDQIKLINEKVIYLFKKDRYDKTIFAFKIGDKTYALDKLTESTKFGQYIDLENSTNAENILKELHILMAILYRPLIKKKGIKDKDYKIERYNDKTVLERAELFKKEMKMDIVLGALFFFMVLKIGYMEHLKGCSMLEIQEKILEVITTTKKVF